MKFNFSLLSIFLFVININGQGIKNYTLFAADSTEILLINHFDSNKENLIFFEGSLPKVSFIKQDSIYYIGNQNIIKLSTKFNLFFLSKPGVPLIAEEGFYDSKGFYINKTDSLNSSYYKKDYLEYYVDQYTLCLRKIRKMYGKKKIILFGHSQGSRIASELTLRNEKYIKELVFTSADPLGRIATLIDQDYVNKGKKEKIDYYIKKFTTKIDSNDLNDEAENLKSWQSFSYPSIITLSFIKIPIFIYYGDSDFTNCPNCYIYDFLPLYFKNIHTTAVNGDHNFFTSDKNSNWSFIIDDVIEKLGK